MYTSTASLLLPCSQGGGVYIDGGIVSFDGVNIFQNTASDFVSARNAPLEEASGLINASTASSLLPCSQGGGVFVQDGTVKFDKCNIHDNKADSVRSHSR